MPKGNKQQKQAINEELASKIDTIRRLFDDRTSSEASTMYRIGAEVVAIKTDEAKYGTTAVKHLARAVGCSSANLYSYATVAETWGDMEFEERIARVDASRRPLTFSHFIELAKVRDQEQRERLLNVALAKSLSVRALSRAARDADSGAPRPASQTAVRSIAPLGPWSLLDLARVVRARAAQDVDEVEKMLGTAGTSTPAEVTAAVEMFEQTLDLHTLVVTALRELVTTPNTSTDVHPAAAPSS